LKNKTKTIAPEKIIVSHRNPDFDAFSASVAAKMLYEDYIIVVSGDPSRNLAEFMRIHDEDFKYYREEEVDFSNVESVIVCDTSTVNRMGDNIRELFNNKKLEVRVYDHHPGIDSNVFPGHEVKESQVEEIGSATTIVVEHIKKKNLFPDTKRASLLAIGIYEDTGNFLFSSTTPRDIKAVAYLLENGANLDMVSAFIKIEMTIDQKKIREELDRNVEIFKINKTKIAIGITETEKFIGGLNLITSKIWQNRSYDTYISIVRMGRKIYVVGRTNSEDVNLGELMGELRGGGHKRAAACKFIDVPLEDVISKVKKGLKKYITPAITAEKIMSTPVKTLLTDMTIKRANKIMEISGFGGIPVIERDRLVGMVLRMDVQKAMNHGLGDRPVKSIMATKILVADIDDSFELLKDMIGKNPIGRIPILDKGVLVGIVSKTDIIREAYNEESKYDRIRYSETEKMYDMEHILRRNLEKNVFKSLKTIGEFGDEFGKKVYVVGGFVRDTLLGYQNLDIDIVIEGNAIEFAEFIQSRRNCEIEKHDKFLTAKIRFDDEFEIDIASARIEYYEYPGALPMVDVASIKKDLYRRDFSINALAVSLNKNSFGELFDFFEGRKDLEVKNIRILYNTSFIDDPTRILRAIRYEQRYGFELEERTFELMSEVLEDKYLDRISGGRIRYELKRSINEKNALGIFLRMGELNIFKALFCRTYFTPLLENKLRNFFEFLPWIRTYYSHVKHFSSLYALFYLLLEYYQEEDMFKIAERYSIKKKNINEMSVLSKRVELIAKFVNKEMKFSDIYSIVEGISPEGMAYIGSYFDENGREYFKEYLRTRKRVKLRFVSGKKLVHEYGIKDGDTIQEIISLTVKKYLDGEIKNAEDEKIFLENSIESRIKDTV